MRSTLLGVVIATLTVSGGVGCAGEAGRGPAPTVGQRPALHCPAPCRWRSVALPRVGVTAQITGMVAVKPTDVWVAMRTGRGWDTPRPGPDETWVTPPEHDVMLHWDGGRWRRVPLPHLHDPITNLTAEGPDDVWGVAESDGLTRWNGKRWSTHTIAGWRHGPEVGRVAALRPRRCVAFGRSLHQPRQPCAGRALGRAPVGACAGADDARRTHEAVGDRRRVIR